MTILFALAHQSRWIAMPRLTVGSFLAVAFLTLTISCGSGDSADPTETQPPPDARAIFDERSTPTPNVEVIEIFPPGAELPIGGNAWWDSKAP